MPIFTLDIYFLINYIKGFNPTAFSFPCFREVTDDTICPLRAENIKHYV